MADGEAPNNRATSARDIPNSLTNRSAISERTRAILVSVSSARSPGRFTKFWLLLGLWNNRSYIIIAQLSQQRPLSFLLHGDAPCSNLLIGSPVDRRRVLIFRVFGGRKGIIQEIARSI